ncbi:MAG: hypothetical protein M1832_002605 [Thelocarpon impressellum]|nr:MAG: hypothetical protein M1832_002605 [Thelocarpon impressellum]
MFARGQLPDNLPQFQTRQALLVVDLQNDFAAVDGKLPVTSPPGYLDRIRDVIPVFRAAGDVIWIRSEFESPRAVNARPGEDASVITDELVSEDLREGKPHSSARDATAGFDLPPPTGSSARAMGLFNRIAARYESHGPAIDEPAIPPNLDQHRETFLSRPACDGDAACCIADTHGSQFADMATPLVDQTRDAVFSKTHYSAFKDTTLLSSLRGNLVTELYICGVLTNISVYATALDAARHGFAITVLDDCLGYRSRARHDEAMKQMTEYMGAESMLSAELIHSIRGGPAAPEHKPERETTPTVGPATGVAELQGLVEGITLREGRSGRAGAAGSGGASGPPVTAEALEAVVEPKGSAAEDERRISPATVGVAASVGTIAPDRAASADIESLGDVEPALPGQAVAAVGTTSPPPSPPRTRLDTAGYVARPVRKKRRPTDPPPPLLDPEESLCEGDTRIQYELLPTSLNDGIFERLRKEVCWRAMFHKGGEVPRLVAVEGEVREDGSMPVYRHPADESPPLLPFSPAVAAIRDEVQKALGQPFNHVLMQCYRNGQDYISEHSDKTLDIVRGSSIVNVSLGAQRTMTLRTKKQDTPAQKASPSGERQEPDAQARRQLQRVPLPHNSMFVLGPATNMRWLHGIRQDRTVSSGRTPSAAETAYDGERISLTFRHIGTFLDKKSTLIWGQGAKSKMKKAAGRTVNGETPEAEGMIIAFGKENQQSEFDWDATYGGGFDVLDITASLPRLFLSGDVVSDLRVKLMLAEAGTVCEMGERAPSAELAGGGPATPKHGDRKVRLVDNDAGRTEVEGSMPILFYVETCHRQGGTFGSVQGRAEIVRLFSSVAQTSELCQAWSNLQMFPVDERTAASFGRELDRYERQAAGSDFLAGPAFTMADCAFYPLLATIMAEWAEWKAAAYPGLQAYHRRVFERRSVQDILRECANLGDAADTITVITAAAAARG